MPACCPQGERISFSVFNAFYHARLLAKQLRSLTFLVRFAIWPSFEYRSAR